MQSTFMSLLQNTTTYTHMSTTKSIILKHKTHHNNTSQHTYYIRHMAYFTNRDS